MHGCVPTHLLTQTSSRLNLALELWFADPCTRTSCGSHPAALASPESVKNADPQVPGQTSYSQICVLTRFPTILKSEKHCTGGPATPPKNARTKLCILERSHEKVVLKLELSPTVETRSSFLHTPASPFLAGPDPVGIHWKCKAKQAFILLQLTFKSRGLKLTLPPPPRRQNSWEGLVR